MDYLSIVLTIILLVLLSIAKELYMIRVEMCRQADKSRDYSKHSAEKLEDKINDAIVAIQVETYKGNG